MDELTASVRHYDRRQVRERLMALELQGGSHAMLSTICACVRPMHHGWTAEECRALADDLAAMLAAGDKLDGTWKAERDRALEELERVTGELEELRAALRTVVREAGA